MANPARGPSAKGARQAFVLPESVLTLWFWRFATKPRGGGEGRAPIRPDPPPCAYPAHRCLRRDGCRIFVPPGRGFCPSRERSNLVVLLLLRPNPVPPARENSPGRNARRDGGFRFGSRAPGARRLAGPAPWELTGSSWHPLGIFDSNYPRALCMCMTGAGCCIFVPSGEGRWSAI